VAAAHYRRDAEFARDDRRVAGAAAAVGDDRAGAFHHRLPVRIGHVGDEHVARLHALHLGQTAHQPRRAGAHLLADRAALGEHGAAAAVALEPVALLDLARTLALHRLGTSLQDVQAPVDAVLAPLDIHRTAVVLFDRERVARELGHLGIGEREAVAHLGRRVHHLNEPSARRPLRRRGELHALQLGAEHAPDHGRPAGLERGLVNVELVRVHCPLHHGFAQAEAGRDEHDVGEARFGVEREHHAGRAEVAAHHALHAGRKRHLGVRETLVHAVADRAIVVERGEDLTHALEHVVDARHVEKALLLAGEARVGQVLGRGRAAHREAGLGRLGRQASEVRADLLLEGRRERGLHHPAADRGAGLGQRAHVVDVERGELVGDALAQTPLLEEEAEGVCRGRETAGHAHAACGELADHFAEAGVLAAHRLDVGHPQLFERNDQGGRQRGRRHVKAP